MNTIPALTVALLAVIFLSGCESDEPITTTTTTTEETVVHPAAPAATSTTTVRTY